MLGITPHTPRRTVLALLDGRLVEFRPKPPLEPYVKFSLHTAPRSSCLLIRFPIIRLLVLHGFFSAIRPFLPLLHLLSQTSQLLRILLPLLISSLLLASFHSFRNLCFSISIYKLIPQFCSESPYQPPCRLYTDHSVANKQAPATVIRARAKGSF